MNRFIKLLPLALLALPMASCDNNVVPRAEYDAVVELADSLEAQNDSLQFELQDLKLYNNYLEQKIDSIKENDKEN